MDITYIFEAGKRVVASKFNTNFNDVKTAVDALETDVADLQTEASNVILPDGSKDFTNLQSYKTNSINNATNATPIVITATAHNYLTGDKVYISEVEGNTAANGLWTITRVTDNTFSLNTSSGNGAYTTGGTAIIYPVADDNLPSKQYVDVVSAQSINTARMPHTPFAVNSAKTNASGYADFIAKVSDTSVVHYAGGSNPNIVETDVLGRTHTITADETITGMTANASAVSGQITRSGTTATVNTTTAHNLTTGDYVTISGCTQVDYNIKAYITVTSATQFTYQVANSPTTPSTGTPVINATFEMLKEYDLTTGVASASTPIATLKLVTEVQILPSVSTALNGNYYTVTGVQPNRQYKVVAGAYVETTFIRRGQVAKTSGTMGTPVSYPFGSKRQTVVNDTSPAVIISSVRTATTWVRKWSDGRIEQEVTITLANSANNSVVFPETFPNTCIDVKGNDQIAGTSVVTFRSFTASGCTAYSNGNTVNYTAVGY